MQHALRPFAKAGEMRMARGPLPPEKRGRPLEALANGSWVVAAFAPKGWQRRFSLVPAAERNPISWTCVRPRTHIASGLPEAAGRAVDLAWQVSTSR